MKWMNANEPKVCDEEKAFLSERHVQSGLLQAAATSLKERG